MDPKDLYLRQWEAGRVKVRENLTAAGNNWEILELERARNLECNINKPDS